MEMVDRIERKSVLSWRFGCGGMQFGRMQAPGVWASTSKTAGPTGTGAGTK